MQNDADRSRDRSEPKCSRMLKLHPNQRLYERAGFEHFAVIQDVKDAICEEPEFVPMSCPRKEQIRNRRSSRVARQTRQRAAAYRGLLLEDIDHVG